MNHFTFIGYVIAVGISLIFCWIPYRLFIQIKLDPQKNRTIIMAIYLLALFIPLISPSFPSIYRNSSIEIGEISAFFVTDPIKHHDNIRFNNESKTGPQNIMLAIYLFGACCSFLITLFHLLQLYKLHKNSRPYKLDGVIVFIHNKRDFSSFSWLNGIYLYKDVLNYNNSDLHSLLIHEKAHIEKLHFIDVLMSQLFLIFQWWNPIAWLLKKELQRVHEYEADASVIDSGVDEIAYQNLLIDNISINQFSGLTDGLNNCSLKKRIIMMQTKNFKKGAVLRILTVGGAALLAALIINVPVMASSLRSQADESIESSNIAVVSSSESSINEDYEKFKKDGVYSAVEFMPKYGGESDPSLLMQDLARTVRYPENAYKKNIQGRPVVQFIVQPDGTVSDVKIVRKADDDLDAEAVRAVKALPKKWTPGYIGKKAVPCYFNLPITFKLQD